MPLIPYPDVPNVEGVPNVPRQANAPYVPPVPQPSTVSSLTQIKNDTPQWQIVNDGGGLFLQPDTYADFNISEECVIPNYPIEQGGFSSYNQVQRPYGIKLTAIITGNKDLTRGTFIQSVKDLKNSLELVTIVTPDTLFQNAKLIRYNWTQKSYQGLTMLSIELVFQEIRQTAVAIVTAATPSGQNQKKIGQVSPIQPTTQQQSQVKSVVFK